MTQRCYEVDPPITKIIASGKRIHQGVHPPVEYQQVTKSHPYEVLFFVMYIVNRLKKLDRYAKINVEFVEHV